STSQASIDNQDKAALYGAALEYAKQNNVALGTQLSQAQLAMVNQPMLWYVEQSVPEPGCSATGGAACPMVQALMPEVLLPPNYAVVNADGEITGTHVALNYANSILNTGTVTAQDLTVNTNSLTNEQRSTNVGTIYQTGQDGVLLQTTGTVVQQGGFMSAANYQLNAQSIAQIGGALQQINADGSVNQAATQQMLSDLKTKLGGNFTQQSVSDNLHTEAVYGDSWLDQLFMTAVMTGLSIMSGVAASGAIGALSSAASGTAFAAAVPATTTTAAIGAGTANLALSAGFAGMMNSTMGQLNAGGSFSVEKMLETGGVAALTAGLTNGITFGNGAPSWSWSASPNSLASLAGVQSVGNTLVPQAGAATGSLPTAIGALAAESVLQAGVQTGLEGGSFLTNLRNSAVSNAAAAAAFAIGNGTDPLTLGNIAAHAALGCAASAAEGTGCGGGAIGGAVSAGLNPIIDANGNIPPAVLTAIETLVSGSVAGSLGFNVQGAATAAQNETLNNYLNHVQTASLVASLKSCASGDTACINQVTASYQSISQQQQQQAKNCDSVTDCATVKNDTLSGYGIGASDAQSYCQGDATCMSFVTGLGRQAVTAKSIATTNWNDISNAVYAAYAQQALTASGLSPIWAGLSPLDAAGAATGLIGAIQPPQFARGIQFQNDALGAMGIPENKQRITVQLADGTPVTVVPDGLPGTTIVEIKDVKNISNSNQFRGYAASGNEIQLVVSPNTATISQPLRELVGQSGGSIRVFDPSTGSFSPWVPK
ncbi:DUF637 domain-containing protein, partial [Burkholderia gladioli]